VDVAVAKEREVLRLSLNNNLALVSGRIQESKARFCRGRKRFSVEQIVAVLRQAQVRVSVAELIREVGISEQTFYRWKNPFTGLGVDQGCELKQLQEENGGRKRRSADLTLDKAMWREVRSIKY
jgi:putative transposase